MPNHQFKFNKQDEYTTPVYAVTPILKYVDKSSVIWCPFDTTDSNYVKVLQRCGYQVTCSHINDGLDFFQYEPKDFDVIISNPPFSLREAILIRLFKLNKPFAILLNEAGLFDSKKRFELLSTNQFEIMVFDRRVNYQTSIESKKGVPFKSIYLCSRILPKPFIFNKLTNDINMLDETK